MVVKLRCRTAFSGTYVRGAFHICSYGVGTYVRGPMNICCFLGTLIHGDYMFIRHILVIIQSVKKHSPLSIDSECKVSVGSV